MLDAEPHHQGAPNLRDGRDVELVEEPPQELECPFHNGLLQDPVVGPCGHSFCSSCVSLRELSSGQLECPLCSEPIVSPLYSNSVATAMISKLQVRCRVHGCREIVPLGQLAVHQHLHKKTTSTPSRSTHQRRASLPRIRRPSSQIFWEIQFEEVKLLHKIGTGAYGEVFKATFRGTYVAVKRITARGSNEEERVKMFSKELDNLKSLRHPNILLFVGACLQRRNMCIVTEFLPGGSLREELDRQKERKNSPDWNQLLSWCVDGATGLAYLHGQQMIHRDVKSNNLLLAESHLKVADFGLASMATSGHRSQAGNWAWMAPEMLRCESYTEKVDVYSFGIVLAEVLTFEEAEELPRTNEMLLDIDALRKLAPEGHPPGLVTLISKCCSNNVDERPPFPTLLHTLKKLHLRAKPQRSGSVPVPRRRHVSLTHERHLEYIHLQIND